MDNSKSIIIIGAGLTGLTTAFYLKKNGFNVTVLEKNAHAGGVIQSHSENGYIFESGPNTGVIANPEVIELFEDLGISNIIERADKEAAVRLIWKKDRWHALPSGLLSAITTPLFSLLDKFRILGEPFRKKGTNPEECLADLVKRRMGKSFLNYAIDPFIGGVYAGDPKKLITKYALPKLYNLEQQHGSFIKGAIAKQKQPKTERDKKATREVFSAKGGLKGLIEGLVKGIGEENIIFNCTDLKIKKSNTCYQFNYTQDDQQQEKVSGQLITACPSHNLPNILEFAEPEEINDLCNMEYAPVSLLIMGYKDWDGDSVKAFGGLVPSREKRNILGVLFMSSFFKNRAPEGSVLFSVFIGGTRNKQLTQMSDEEIINLGRKEVESMLNPIHSQPDLIKIFKYKFAIPQYEITSKQRFERVDQMQNKYPGLTIGGNLKDGIGMADRILQARTIADRITTNKDT